MARNDIVVIGHHTASQPGPLLTVGLAQVGGPWLDGPARLARLIDYCTTAADKGCDVVAFPETYLNGYPFWLPRTGGARFNDPDQKACYAYYLESALEVPGPQVREIISLSADLGITIIVGVTERGVGSGRGSTYCSVLTIDPRSGLVGHHRKLVPTYDERLVWANGDGAGLRTHTVGYAVVGSLNCWENWMPSARQALYADGEDVHISVWPGSTGLTTDITRFVALEGRVFSVAVSGVLRAEDVPDDFPLAQELRAHSAGIAFNGGSAVAGPDGQWLVAPVPDAEGLVIAELDLNLIYRERLTFDPTGHYSRPDVFVNTVLRDRRNAVTFVDGEDWPDER